MMEEDLSEKLTIASLILTSAAVSHELKAAEFCSYLVMLKIILLALLC